MSKFNDMEFTKILNMIEFLHAENLYIINLMLHMHLKKNEADKGYEEISRQMIKEFDKCRKDW